MNYVIETGRRQRKRQAMHQMLLDVAQHLFEEQGIARTTVDDIAEAADVARTTVFNHFPSKEAIALELASDITQDIAQQAQALLDSGMPALDVLQSVARSFLDASLARGDSAVAVARELLHPELERSARAQQLVPVRQIIEAILLQAREEDAVREDIPLEVVAECFSALLVQTVTQVMTCEVPSLRERLSVSLDILFNGITERRT